MGLHHARTVGAVVIAAAAGAWVAPAPSAGAATAPITVSPAAAAPGSTVTVSGSGCLPGPVLNLLDKVIVNVAGVGALTTTVNADGTWSVPVVVPAVGPTALKVTANCLADGLLGSALDYTSGLLNVVTNAVGDTAATVGATLPTGDVQAGITVPTTWDMHDDIVDTTPRVEAGGDDTPTNGTSKVGAAGTDGATGAAGTAGAAGAAGATGGAGATGASGAGGDAGTSGAGGSATAAAGTDAAGGTDAAATDGAPTELASVDCTGDDCATTTDDGTSWWVWALGGIAAACLATAGVAAVRRRRSGITTGTSVPRHEHSRSRS